MDVGVYLGSCRASLCGSASTGAVWGCVHGLGVGSVLLIGTWSLVASSDVWEFNILSRTKLLFLPGTLNNLSE